MGNGRKSGPFHLSIRPVTAQARVEYFVPFLPLPHLFLLVALVVQVCLVRRSSLQRGAPPVALPPSSQLHQNLGQVSIQSPVRQLFDRHAIICYYAWRIEGFTRVLWCMMLRAADLTPRQVEEHLDNSIYPTGPPKKQAWWTPSSDRRDLAFQAKDRFLQGAKVRQ